MKLKSLRIIRRKFKPGIKRSKGPIKVNSSKNSPPKVTTSKGIKRTSLGGRGSSAFRVGRK